MRLTRGTLALLIVSVIVVIGVMLFQQPLTNLITAPTSSPSVQTLLPFDIAQQATRLTIRQGDAFTQIDRIDGVWQITDGTALDDSRDTNSDFVNGVLRLMATFEYSRVFATDDFTQYGLANPDNVVMITSTDDIFELYLGTTNPDGDQLYIRVNQTLDVYLVPAVFEFSNILRLATDPPYQDTSVGDNELPDNLLFPDVFGYQIRTFSIRDQRDGSVITYTQGEQGTWALDGTVVNTDIEVDYSQAAVNVSQFLFLEVEPLDESAIESLSELPILSLSMTTDDNSTYRMEIYIVEDVGYAGVVDNGDDEVVYALPTDTVNLFFDMVTTPPYVSIERR